MLPDNAPLGDYNRFPEGDRGYHPSREGIPFIIEFCAKTVGQLEGDARTVAQRVLSSQ